MGKKMYYSEQEASQKLGLPAAEIAKLVADGKLRVFADGPRKMFKAEEVEAMASNASAASAPPAPAAPAAGESGEIILTPADSTAHDAIALSDDSGLGTIPAKEDTVPTSQGGVSVFDEADLEIEAADPMAKTVMAPSVEDGLSAESVGSGSGLLDLTREPDDTSLGAVLEDISVEGGPGASGSGSGTAVVSGTGMAEAVAEEQILTEEAVPTASAAEPAVIEAIDPMAGLFSGLAIASGIIMLVLAAVAVPLLLSPDVLPGHVAVLQANLPIVVAAVAVVAILLAVIGYVTGRSAATRSAALTQK